MKSVLQFGIPSFDALLGKKSIADDSAASPYSYDAHGIHLEEAKHTTSICFIGPAGTGKSVFGLHLAAQYIADIHAISSHSRVLYVSTDLKYHMANAMWNNFGLLHPNQRDFPFYWGYRHNLSKLKVKLDRLDPTTAENMLVEPANNECGVVHFVDLVSTTMGDDWGFINRLLAVLESPKNKKEDPHLVIIDAVEGFETLVGERDAFGETTSRRARIAQVMRTAGEKCHVAFIVEEPKNDERFPEEFVTDIVVRLRNVAIRDYARRTVEVVKARGQSHIRGQHPFVIRDGTGSTTGSQENPDDPAVNNSYVHVFPSLHSLSRAEMRTRGVRNPAPIPDRVAAFGITYLDEMLAHVSPASAAPFEDQGLPTQTTTALIGEIATEKTSLATAFLARTFRPFTFQLADIIRELSSPTSGLTQTRQALTIRISFAIRIGGQASDLAPPEPTDKTVDALIASIERCLKAQDPESIEGANEELRELLSCIKLPSAKDFTGPSFTLQRELVKFAVWLAGAFAHNGAAVLLTTSDYHLEKIVKEFERWLETSRQRALATSHSDARCPVPEVYRSAFKDAVHDHVRSRTICRRLELHDLSSVSLFHIVQRLVECAQQKVFLSDDLLQPTDGNSKSVDRLPADRTIRFQNSWNIRVVIDDLSTLRDIYPDISFDPLFLPFLLSYLELEGVTALLIDSQEGRPDAQVTDKLHNELRARVPHRLHTWRVPFYGEIRDAITVVPPFPTGLPSSVREVRWEQTAGDSNALLVDPELELYSGLAKGEPKPIPLRVCLYQQTEPFAKYIQEENEIFSKLFTPLAGADDKVIVGMETGQYNTLWSYCNLQTGILLDHTRVLQVDEFWVTDREPIGDPSRYPKGPVSRRAGKLYPLGRYLTEETSWLNQPEASDRSNLSGSDRLQDERFLVPNPVADPFGLFQGRPSNLSSELGGPRPWERRHYFPRYTALSGEPKALGSEKKARIDRVPFAWDFGFLLCPSSMWDLAGEYKIGHHEWTVKRVWESLAKVGEPRFNNYVSWRTFLGACKTVAQVQAERTASAVRVLDLPLSTGESFLCLMLEIWASEILDGMKTSKEETRKFVDSFNHINWESPSKEGLIEWLKIHRLAFYKTWLLLIDSLPLSDFVDRQTSPHLKSRAVDGSAVATRHWYKTACGKQDCPVTQQIALPVRLPGHFSVRGDWFLALAGGSRSERLGRRALDLLSSRRGNLRRMELGLGLPTRDISTLDVLPTLPTALVKLDKSGHTVAITYSELTGPDKVWLKDDKSGQKTLDKRTSDFHWLWRSQLRDYHRHSRLWQRWTAQMVIMWDDLRSQKGPFWRGGFEVYDLLEDRSVTEAQEIIEDKQLSSWNEFEKMCNFLVQELHIASVSSAREKAASPLPHPQANSAVAGL